MKTAYLRAADRADDGQLTQMVGRTLPLPLDVTTTRPQPARVVDNVDDDVEACQLYEWTQNLSVEDYAATPRDFSH